MVDNLIYSILGVVLGGVCVNIVNIEYSKLREKKEKMKVEQKESQRKVIERLKEIEYSLENDISADHPKYKKIQNECLIFSNQLTNTLSQVTGNIPEEIIYYLKSLNSDLTELGNFPIYQGYNLLGDCRSIIKTTKQIIREIENLNN